MVGLPASCEARQRRSPAMSWKRPLASGRTRTGCTTPLAVMEAASSANCSSLTLERVWKGLRIDLVEGNLAGLAAFGFGGRSGGGLHAREKGIEALAQGAAFGVDGGDGHGSKSSNPGDDLPGLHNLSVAGDPAMWLRPQCERKRPSGVWPESDFVVRTESGLAESAEQQLCAPALRGLSNLIAGEKLAGQLEIGLGSAGAGIVEGDGLAVAGRLSQANVARNHGAIEPLAEVLAQGLGHLLGQVGAVVVHGEQNAFDGDVGIEGGADAFESGDELGDAFEGEVLGLHGNDEGVGGGEDVEGEQVERRRAIQDDQVEVCPESGSRAWRRRRARSLAAASSILAPVRFFEPGRSERQIDFGGENDLLGGGSRP